MGLSRIRKIGGMALAFFATVIIGVFAQEYTAQFDATQSTEGVVTHKAVSTVRSSRHHNRQARTLPSYTVEFTTETRDVETIRTEGLPFLELDEGGRYPVRYNPDDPNDAVVDVWFMLYPFSVVAAAFFAIALLLFTINITLIYPRIMRDA